MSSRCVCKVCGKEFDSATPRVICSRECNSKFKMKNALHPRRRVCGYKTQLSEQAREIMHQYCGVQDNTLKQLVVNVLNSIGQSYQVDYAIGDLTYDIYIPALRTVMCIDASVNTVAFRDVEDSIYIHRDDGYLKSMYAADHGYRCIHWYDWDDIFKLPLMLSNPAPIYARDCKIDYVGIPESNLFLNMYHLQKARNGVKISLGLFYHNNLVEVMTCGHPRFNSNYEWEIFRFCSDPTIRVIGGASKLFKRFIESVNPKSVITYCDVAKFTGNVYDNMGLKFRSFTNPSIIWSRGAEQLSNNILTRFRYDGLFNTHYGKDANNTELMIMNGWLPVYNCGQYTYDWVS